MSDSNEVSKGCVTHYDNRHLQVRLDYLGLCAYDKSLFEEKRKEEPNQECMAKILRLLETLTDHQKMQWHLEALKAKEKGLKIPPEPKEYPIQLSNGMIVSLIFDTFKESTVRNSLDYLLSLGYIERQQPKKNATPFYWLNLEKINTLLKEQAEVRLAGYDFKPLSISTQQGAISNPDPVISNPAHSFSNPDPSKTDPSGFEIKHNNITNIDNIGNTERDSSLGGSTFVSPPQSNETPYQELPIVNATSTTHPDTPTSEHTQGEDHEHSLPVTHRASDMERNHHRDSSPSDAQGEQEEIAVSGSLLTTRNDLEDEDTEITEKRPVVLLPPQGERNTRHVSDNHAPDSDVLPGRVPGSAYDGTSEGGRQGRTGIIPGIISDVGTPNAQEVVQPILQHTTQVPSAGSLFSSHPPQQATNAPVASVPPDREQRGAGETQEVYDTPEAWESAQKAFLEALRQEWESLSKPEKTKRGGRWDAYKKQQWDAWKAEHPKPKDEALDEACREIYRKIVTEWRGYEWDNGKAIMNERTFIRNFCLKYRRDHPDTVAFFGQVIEHMTTKTFKWSQESYRYKWSASDVYHETDAILQLWKNPPKPNGKPAYNGNSNGKGHLTTVPRTTLDVPTFTAADYDRLRSMPV